MNYKSSFLFILFILIAVNTGGLILKYFQYDTFFIFLGFRFHISFLIPFLLILRKENSPIIKSFFLKPDYKGKFIPLLWILIPIIIICILPFTVTFIKESDPEYFYEFGISSVIDYPIYLLWNFPQLALLWLFLTLTSRNRKRKFLTLLLLSFFLFVFEFITIKPETDPAADYNGLAALLITALISSVLISSYKNIYWFGVSIFSIFWIYFLAFGSSSPLVLNLLFAAKYKSWDGFLLIDKGLTPYFLHFYLLLIFSILCAVLPFRKNLHSELQLNESANFPKVPNVN